MYVSTGKNEFMGEYLMNAQGEDVVAGIRTPQKLSQLEKENPKVYDQLCKIRDRLEKHYHDMQDMEFTVEEGKLFMLQCRNGKRTGAAAVKMAVDMVAEKLITKEQALLRVEPEQLNQLLLPQLDKEAVKKATEIAAGLNAQKLGQRTERKFFSFVKKHLLMISPVWLLHRVSLHQLVDVHHTLP